MTTLLPALEDELLRTARRVLPAAATAAAPAPAAAPSRRARRAPRRHRGAPLVAILAAVLMASGGAYAARGVWLPVLGNDSYGHAQATRDAPPADQLAILGVLRREQTPADRSPAVRAVLETLDPYYGAVRTDAVRNLGTLPDGVIAVLVPVHVTRPVDPALARDLLYLGFYDPVTDEVTPPTIPSDAREVRAGGSLMQLGERLTAAQRAKADAYHAREAAAGRLERGPGAPPRYGMLSGKQVDRLRALTGRDGKSPATVLGLVPDGVAAVQVNDDPPVAVQNNLFTGATVADGGERIRWLDADGHLIQPDR